MFSACYWEGWPTGADLPGFTARKAWTKAQLYRESDGWVDRMGWMGGLAAAKPSGQRETRNVIGGRKPKPLTPLGDRTCVIVSPPVGAAPLWGK